MARQNSSLLDRVLSEDIIAEMSQVARAAGISTWHIQKAAYCYSLIDERLTKEGIEYNFVANLFCGNGLATWYWLMQKEEIESISADIRQTSKYRKVENEVLSAYSELQNRNNFVQSDLTVPETYNRLKPNSLVIAIHACGNLADAFIKNCTKRHQLFALVTCCHNSHSLVLTPQEYPSGKDYDPRNFGLYQDLIRAQYAREQGYRIYWEQLPEEITPKNRIMIGIPD